MNTSAPNTSSDDVLMKRIKRKNQILILLIVIIILLSIALIIIGVIVGKADSNSPSSSESEWELPLESDYDAGNGISLNCTAGDKVWNTGFYTISICDGLYVYGDGFYSGMLLVTSTGIIFMDAPYSLYAALPLIASSVSDNDITTIIYSHHHGDHISGSSQIPNIDTADIICHRNCYEALVRRPLAVQCNIVLDLTADNDTYIIQDGDQYVILKYAGYQYHTNDDLIIFAPRQQTVMMIDVIYPKWIPYKYLGLAYDPDGIISVHHYLLNNVTSSIYGDWNNFVGGHVDQLGDRTDVQINLDYIDDLYDAVHEAANNPNLSFVYVLGNEYGWNVDGTNQWDIVKSYQDGVAQECSRIMIEEKNWDQIFYGMDAYSADNCFWIFQEEHINLE